MPSIDDFAVLAVILAVAAGFAVYYKITRKPVERETPAWKKWQDVSNQDDVNRQDRS